MNFDFTGSRWFLLLISIVLPLVLLAAAILLHAGLCYIFILLTWIGVAVMVLFIPKSDD